jgi:trehalose 6-phosphate phosphatase
MRQDLIDQDLAEVPLQEDIPSPQTASRKLATSELAQRLGECAMLLDIDGTLLDLAPTPREVWVPPGLSETLNRLLEKTSGALALVSGRSLNDIDLIFAPEQFPAVGGHGAEMRIATDSESVATHAPPMDKELKRRLAAIAKLSPGILLEDKGYSLALHYRLVPKQGVGLIHDVKHAYETWADHSYELLAGKAVLEIKHANFNKGSAVRDLMTYPPFHGRVPIFVGDDRTDEDAFDVMAEFKGEAMSVGRKLPHVEKHFDCPADVRHWLALLAAPVMAKVTSDS